MSLKKPGTYTVPYTVQHCMSMSADMEEEDEEALFFDTQREGLADDDEGEDVDDDDERARLQGANAADTSIIPTALPSPTPHHASFPSTTHVVLTLTH